MIVESGIYERIEKETKFKFLYNHKEVDIERIVSLKVENETLDKVISKLFFNTNISYVIRKKQIILKAEEPPAKNMVVPYEAMKNNDIPALQKSINGTIVDQEGNPLPGANIIEKGTTNGTQADFDGNFSIKVADDKAVLVISYIGFASKEIAIAETTNFTIALEESTSGLDEVIVIGYGYTKGSSFNGFCWYSI